MTMIRTTCRAGLTVAVLALAVAGLYGCGGAKPDGKAPAPKADGAPAENAPAGPTLTAKKVDQIPAVDGVADEAWAALPELTLTAVHEDTKVPVTLKACHDGTTFYLLASWPDPDASEQHKPWVWDEKSGKYAGGPQREDRLAFEIPLGETFDACMLGGTPYVADVWHWKAARTNPSRRVEDEWHKIATEAFKVDGADAPMYPKSGRDGRTTIYMARVKDVGQLCNTSQKAPAEKGEALVTRYVAQEPDGGQVDVTAQGVWKDGRWTVEFARALACTNKDEDIHLEPGKRYPFALAVFDKVADDEHATTEQGTLVIE